MGVFTDPAVGRPRRYCSNACRQAAYRQRLRERRRDTYRSGVN